MTSAPGWTVSLSEMKDRRTMEDGLAPEGKKWECCTACNGRGKILVDDIPEVKSPEEKRRPGNNPFGPRGTLRCLACQRRKKKCEFDSPEGACLRCLARGLDCGKKLPPQQRPRSITSVPSDYRRPVSLHIDTRMLSTNNQNYSTGFLDEGGSPLSPSGGLHSMPVSPYIMPWNYSNGQHLDPRSASVTPIDGSPVPFTLEQFETNAGIGINLTTEEERNIENIFNMYNTNTSATIAAPMMSHQTSQQTITQQQQQLQSQFQGPTSAPALNFIPVFDDDEEMDEAGKAPADMERPTSRHSQYLSPTSPHHEHELQHQQSQQTASTPNTWDIFSPIPQNFNPFPPSLQNRPSSSLSQPPPHCIQCGTVQSRAWRKNPITPTDGTLFCEKCASEQITNITQARQQQQQQQPPGTQGNVPGQSSLQGLASGPGQVYWRNKFSRMEAPSFNSIMSEESNADSQGGFKGSQESSEEMLLFEMQL